MNIQEERVTTMDNMASLNGVINSPLIFSHEIFGEKFYTTTLSVTRQSNTTDIIPLMISEHLLKNKNYIGSIVEVCGSFRSYNQHIEEKRHLILFLFVQEIYFINKSPDINKNTISLTGTICKAPIYRQTPLGRQITDLLLAVNRPCGKSDYIPCITWGRYARYASELNVGTKINVQGRIQSREYFKKIEYTYLKKTAYEVSVRNMHSIY